MATREGIMAESHRIIEGNLVIEKKKARFTLEGLCELFKYFHSPGVIFPDDDRIDDGFGTEVSAYCPECEEKSRFFYRLGDVRCSKCGERENERKD